MYNGNIKCNIALISVYQMFVPATGQHPVFLHWKNSLWLSSGSLYKVTGLVFNLTYFCYCLWWHLMFLYMVYMVKILPHKKLKPYDLAIL